MVTLGLDIGTTTISAVAVEEGRVLAAETLPNDAALPCEAWERKQDPRRKNKQNQKKTPVKHIIQHRCQKNSFGPVKHPLPSAQRIRLILDTLQV